MDELPIMTLSLYIQYIAYLSLQYRWIQYNMEIHMNMTYCFFFRLREEYIQQLQKERNNSNETAESERKMRIDREKKQVLYNMLCNIYILS